MVNKGGRPKIEIDWRRFDDYCELQCTLSEIASMFNCSEDTIERRVKSDHKMGFAEYYAIKRGRGKQSLRRKLWKMAEKHPAVAIFLAKNHLGMADKQEILVDRKYVSAMTDAELEAMIK